MVSWWKGIIPHCSNCGRKNWEIRSEHTPCFECGAELVLAVKNELYSVTETCCSSCGAVDNAPHYVANCKKCGNTLRFRITLDGVEFAGQEFVEQESVRLRVQGLRDNELTISRDYYSNMVWVESAKLDTKTCPHTAPFRRRTREVIRCPNCQFLFYTWKREEITKCPNCKFLIDVKSYMWEIYGFVKHERLVDFDDLPIEALLPKSPMVTING